LLESESILSVLDRERLTRAQKIHHLKKRLFNLRYPLISSYQEKMRNETEKLRFNSKMDLIYDRFFESGNIIIQLRISSLDDLLKSIEDLNSEHNLHAIKKILDRL
jgi:hypothetical protein